MLALESLEPTVHASYVQSNQLRVSDSRSVHSVSAFSGTWAAPVKKP